MAQDRLSIARGTVRVNRPYLFEPCRNRSPLFRNNKLIICEQQMEFPSKLAEQEKRIEALMSDLQKVSAGLDAR